ncbi:hypothetical protein [Bradyrhizobium sp. Arg816]|uniref:hypothetical protein n=1 Tax=Bradyrhizobium sp. Arg816 TaxID=2998491 RepID=UPI00249F699B|nr:hypothetical protein [Bradyrhizobium sp. Arg816]MDI3563523.1 hypothetical protein [Bradyrhizobium sp. Arg816]
MTDHRIPLSIDADGKVVGIGPETEVYRVRDVIASHIACEEDCQKMPTGCGCALTAARALVVSHAQCGAGHPLTEAVAYWMMNNGYATGHGDSLSGLLLELVGQVREQTERRTPAQRERPFYGAQCQTYPNCSGGCGLGCTKEHATAAYDESAALITAAVKERDELFEEVLRLEALVEKQRSCIDWISTWVSQPAGNFSVYALDGLFGMARDRIASLASSSNDKRRL